MKSLILLATLIAVLPILAASPASVMSDTSASLTDTSLPDHEVTSSEASNGSASATVTTTRTGATWRRMIRA